MFWPRNVKGRPGSSSCNLPNAIRLPVTVTGGEADEIFADAHQGGGKRAKRVAERDALGHCRHGHPKPQGISGYRADRGADEDPLIRDDASLKQGGENGYSHAKRG